MTGKLTSKLCNLFLFVLFDWYFLLGTHTCVHIAFIPNTCGIVARVYIFNDFNTYDDVTVTEKYSAEAVLLEFPCITYTFFVTP